MGPLPKGERGQGLDTLISSYIYQLMPYFLFVKFLD